VEEIDRGNPSSPLKEGTRHHDGSRILPEIDVKIPEKPEKIGDIQRACTHAPLFMGLLRNTAKQTKKGPHCLQKYWKDI